MISAWRANEPSAISPSVGGASAAVPDDPVVRVGLRCPAGAPGTVQPSKVSPSSSNDVVPGAGRHDDVVDEHAGPLDDVVAGVADRHLDVARRRRRTGRPPTARSRRWRPLAAHQSPGVPGRRAGAVAVVGLVVLEERVQSRARTGRTKPVSWLVWPLRSGSVVQSSCPTVWASTNTKSQLGSVSRVTQNDSCAPPAGTLIVRASRLYDEVAPTWETGRTGSPVRGAAPERTGRGRARPRTGCRLSR